MGQIDYKRIYKKNRDNWKEATSEGNHKFEQLFAGQYSENNHFIYELLQNADDVGATFITFVYQEKQLTVYHNGSPFTEANVEAICSVMDGTKDKNDAQTIGHFGFGFKSVFKYTDRPEVYSDQEAFAIERYLLPAEIPLGDFPKDCEYQVGGQIVHPFEKSEHSTKFVLPFKAGLENAGIDPRDISKKLAGLEPEILLFLEHIQTLTWIDETTGNHGEYKRVVEEESSNKERSGFGQICSCKATRSIDDKDSSESLRYLVYEDVFPLMEMTSACVKIAFKFQKAAISPADNAKIWVFFPTTDDSQLKFLVHGTYQTPISREKIITDSNFNRKLLRKTEDLAVKILPDLCERKLMSQTVLREVLLPSFGASCFPLLKEKITAVFQKEAFLPTSDGNEGYSCPDALRLPVPYDMPRIISRQQIISMGGPDIHFVAFNDVNGTGSAAYYRWLKDDLGVKLWTISDFSDLISEENAKKFNGDTSVLVPLSKIFLPKIFRINLWGSGRNQDYSEDLGNASYSACKKLKQAVMIPNRAGGLSAAWVDGKENIFFADTSKRTGKEYVSLDEIDEEKREDISTFLKKQLNVEPYSHEKYVEIHIIPKYRNCPMSVGDEEHIQDIKQMKECGRWVCEYDIIRVKDYSGKVDYVFPQYEYLYFETDSSGNSIKDYLKYLPLEDCETFYFVDMEFYESHGITRNDLLRFGISENILVGESETEGEYDAGNPGRRPTWRTFGNFRWNLSIKGLNNALIYISQHPDTQNAKEKSKFIFHILQENVDRLVGKVFISGQSVPDKDNEPAKIINQLRNESRRNGQYYYDDEIDWNWKWLYTKSGRLVSQYEITKRELDTDLYGNVSMDSPLYDLLGFKKDAIDQFEDKIKAYDKLSKEKQETYFEGGLFRKYGITLDKLDKILAAKTLKPSFEFPSQSVRDLERLKCHVEKQFACSSPVRYEMLQRSVRVTSNDGKAYLRDQYEVDGRQYACQLCHQPKPRFEAVQVTERPKWELDQMHLSLCPDCAEAYRDIRRNKPLMVALLNQILAWDETQPQSGPVEVPIGEDGQSLWFSPIHLAEVKLLLQLLDQEAQISED